MAYQFILVIKWQLFDSLNKGVIYCPGLLNACTTLECYVSLFTFYTVINNGTTNKSDKVCKNNLLESKKILYYVYKFIVIKSNNYNGKRPNTILMIT